MHWPQITYLALTVMNLMIVKSKDGQPRTGTHRFEHDIIGSGIAMLLLYCGGFFSQP